MKKVLDVALSIVLVVCAVAMTSMYAYKQTRPVEQNASSPPVKVDDWPNVLAAGRVLTGHDAARLKIAVLTDFECPSCRGLHSRLHDWAAAYPSDLQVKYIHYPLDYHSFALPAARVAECLKDVVPLQRWSDVIFTQQDSLGHKSWAQFAHEAGAADTSGVESCAKSSQSIPQIEAGLRIGQNVSLKGTPTVIANGWKLSKPPTRQQIDSMILALRNEQ